MQPYSSKNLLQKLFGGFICYPKGMPHLRASSRILWIGAATGLALHTWAREPTLSANASEPPLNPALKIFKGEKGLKALLKAHMVALRNPSFP